DRWKCSHVRYCDPAPGRIVTRKLQFAPGGSNPPPSVCLVGAERYANCITHLHSKSADFQQNPILLFEVVSDMQPRDEKGIDARQTPSHTSTAGSVSPPSFASPRRTGGGRLRVL